MSTATLIDTQADATIPSEWQGWQVVRHFTHEPVAWDGRRFRLYVPEIKLIGSGVTGRALYHQLLRNRLKPVNANILDWLMVNQKFVSPEWKIVCFWGTLFKAPRGHIFVRCLTQNKDGACTATGLWIGQSFFQHNPILIWA